MLHPTRFHAPTQTPTPPGVYFPPPQKVASLTTKPLSVVLVHAGPLDISPMVASPRVGAILSMWHPGQHGSVALADLLLGRTSPSGEKRGHQGWQGALVLLNGAGGMCKHAVGGARA